MWQLVGIGLYLAVGLLIFPLSKRYPRQLGPSRELMEFAAAESIDSNIVGLLIWAFWPLVIVFGFFLACNTLEGPIKPSSDSESSQRPLTESKGVAVTDMKPSGKVEVDGKPYNATSMNKFIPKGSSVRIVDRQGMNFIVEELVNQAD